MSGQEWHVEMRWVCASCSEKNLGRNLQCQRCGKPKSGREEYVMPDDTSQAAAVADPGLLRMATAGANWRCHFCGSDQRRLDGSCGHCGADPSQGIDLGAEPDPTAQARRTAPAGWACPACHAPNPTGGYNCRRCGYLKARWLPFAILGGALLLIFGGGLLMSLGMRARPEPPPVAVAQPVVTAEPAREISARLAGVEWEQSVVVERYQLAQAEGFEKPADAIDARRSGQRQHHVDKVQDGTTTESYTETVPDGTTTESYTEQQACGETCTDSPQSCSNQCTAQKNGFAKCKQVCTGGGRSCKTRYCPVTRTRQVPRTRTVTRTRQVPRYKEVAVMRDWYVWKAWTWVQNRTLKASGATAETSWPPEREVALDQKLGKGERERASRIGTYRLRFSGDDGAEYQLSARDLDEFRRRAAAPVARLRVTAGAAQFAD